MSKSKETSKVPYLSSKIESMIMTLSSPSAKLRESLNNKMIEAKESKHSTKTRNSIKMNSLVEPSNSNVVVETLYTNSTTALKQVATMYSNKEFLRQLVSPAHSVFSQ